MKLRTKSERDEILQSIFELYPTKIIELDFKTPFQLLTAVMLSAQMTDKGVNKATKKLFEIVKTPANLLKLEQEKVEVMLRGVNYYRVKTKHLFMTAEKLVTEFHGKIPHTLETIRTLP
jgi:endonuclease III